MNFVAVAEKADVARRSGEARVRLAVESRAAVTERRHVGVEDRNAVDCDCHLRSPRRDLLAVPLAHWLQAAPLRRDHAVDRAVHLPILQTGVFGMAVVENLELHALEGGGALDRRADAQAVVRPGRQPEVEPEDKVAELTLREQVATDALRGADLPIDHPVARDVALPASERTPVEQWHEARLAGSRGGGRRRILDLSDLQATKLHRRALGLEAQIPRCRRAV